MTTSGALRLIRSVGLQASGPAPWGTGHLSRSPGVYVIETPQSLLAAPIDEAAVRAWIARVPSLNLDGTRPTVYALGERLAEFWIAGEAVVYVGLAGTSLDSRVRGFFRTPLGDPRPHAGGHWLKTLRGLDTFLIWWAETDEPVRYERELLDEFARRARTSARGLAAELALPFANRQSADRRRKPHGITRSTLSTPRVGDERPSVPMDASGRHPGVALKDPGDRLARINAVLQTAACASPERRVAAVEAAHELSRLGLLRDSPTRPGLPLRNLLREGKIDHAYQEARRRWFIGCGER